MTSQFQQHVNAMWEHKTPPKLVHTLRGEALAEITMLNVPARLRWDWTHGWWAIRLDSPEVA